MTRSQKWKQLKEVGNTIHLMKLKGHATDQLEDEARRLFDELIEEQF